MSGYKLRKSSKYVFCCWLISLLIAISPPNAYADNNSINNLGIEIGFDWNLVREIYPDFSDNSYFNEIEPKESYRYNAYINSVFSPSALNKYLIFSHLFIELDTSQKPRIVSRVISEAYLKSSAEITDVMNIFIDEYGETSEKYEGEYSLSSRKILHASIAWGVGCLIPVVDQKNVYYFPLDGSHLLVRFETWAEYPDRIVVLIDLYGADRAQYNRGILSTYEPEFQECEEKYVK